MNNTISLCAGIYQINLIIFEVKSKLIFYLLKNLNQKIELRLNMNEKIQLCE